MKKKVVLVAFNGDMVCFVHVLLNALDMHNRGYEVKLVIEGSATKLLEKLADGTSPLSKMYEEVKQKGLIDCVCQACASKMGTMEIAKKQNLNLNNEMTGHPSIGNYMEKGYEVITF